MLVQRNKSIQSKFWNNYKASVYKMKHRQRRVRRRKREEKDCRRGQRRSRPGAVETATGRRIQRLGVDGATQALCGQLQPQLSDSEAQTGTPQRENSETPAELRRWLEKANVDGSMSEGRSGWRLCLKACPVAAATHGRGREEVENGDKAARRI